MALDLGAVDVAPITEPLWSKVKDKYRAVVRASELLPPLDNVVGVTTGKAAASARRLHPRRDPRAPPGGRLHVCQSGRVPPTSSPRSTISTPEVARSAVHNLLGSHEKSGVRYWGGGEINLKAMNEMMRAQKLVGALKGDRTGARSSTTASCPTI